MSEDVLGFKFIVPATLGAVSGLGGSAEDPDFIPTWVNETAYYEEPYKVFNPLNSGWDLYRGRVVGGAGSAGLAPSKTEPRWQFYNVLYPNYSALAQYYKDDIVQDLTVHKNYKRRTGTTKAVTLSASATPGVVTSVAHGLANNTKVMLRELPAGISFAGLVAGTTYFVRNAAADTFELSTTSGGASIAFGGSSTAPATLYVANAAGAPLSNATEWAYDGPTNSYAGFDSTIGTKVTMAGSSVPSALEASSGIQQMSLSYRFEMEGRFNGLALIGVRAYSVQVITYDANDTLMKSEIIDLRENRFVTDYYTYCFAPIFYREKVFVPLPNLYNGTVDLVFRCCEDIEIGEIVIGQTIELGVTNYGAQLGRDDFTTQGRDPFGGWNVIEREYSDNNNFQVKIAGQDFAEVASMVSVIKQVLAKYRATPLVFIGKEGYDATITYGYYSDTVIDIQYATRALLSIKTKGLV